MMRSTHFMAFHNLARSFVDMIGIEQLGYAEIVSDLQV